MLVIVFLERSNPMKEAYKAMRMMFTMVFACIIAVIVGNAFDEIFHTSPILLLVFLAYAIGSSLYLMIKRLGNDNE